MRFRFSFDDDVTAIVEMLSQEGNPYKWSQEKWRHYYLDYPEGQALSMVAVLGSKGIVGHYGLLPIRIDNYSAMLAVHAFVRKEVRGLEIISGLLDMVYEACRERKVDFICGFPNDFNKVYTRLFGWKCIGWLRFTDANVVDLSAYNNRVKFTYSESWYEWKFGAIKPFYVQSYEKGGATYFQLLKARSLRRIEAGSLGVAAINFWDPEKYERKSVSGKWTQAFSIRIINDEIRDERLLDLNHWFIEMGDSDAFERRENW